MISDEQERVEAKDAHILDIAHAIFHINISDNYDFFLLFSGIRERFIIWWHAIQTWI